MRSVWWHRLLLASLFVVIVAAASLLGASSVHTWIDQNAQRQQEELTNQQLEAEIAVLEDEIARRTSQDEVRREALCFGPYVAPGTEVYSVAGLEGCVSPSRAP
ncbi:MAG: hypothetical protein OXE79_08710 [Acidimicrobiaceae bacterium]|nr:hypothetical protein [Acidimicrobiaceae bacterium]MCY4175626.1 hypothetical protein [Acidimicrobiaceae bacterium]MCY4294092.1 hypothetical protein [Acidimicrobiaceae bacterium]